MMNDKKTNRSTWVTLGVSLLLIAGVCAALVLYFRGLQEGDPSYTVLEKVEAAESEQSVSEDSDIPMDASEDKASVPMNDQIQSENEVDAEPVQTENLAVAKAEQITNLEKMESGKILREFTTEEQTFYLMEIGEGDHPDPTGVSVTAEEAAETSLKAWKEMFPENEWEGPFRIQLAQVLPNQLYGDAPSEPMSLWMVDTILSCNSGNPTQVSMAIVNPESGEVIMLNCPREDNSASTVKTISPNEPYFSLQDFLFLSDDYTWITQGNKLIRTNKLGDTVNGTIVFDEEKGIDISMYGVVQADYYVGKGADAQKIKVTMDLYTKQLTGYLFYDRF